MADMLGATKADVEAAEAWASIRHWSNEAAREAAIIGKLAGIARERERCAKVAEAWGREGNTIHPFTLDIAAKIRSGE